MNVKYNFKTVRAYADQLKPMPNRDITNCVSTFQVMARRLEEDCKKVGIVIGWSNTLRSWKLQDSLFAQGRTKPGKKVTDVRGGESMHNFGFAGDLYIISYPGKPKGSKIIYPDREMAIVVAKARKIGFYCGMDWGDDPHLQIVPATFKEQEKVIKGTHKYWGDCV